MDKHLIVLDRGPPRFTIVPGRLGVMLVWGADTSVRNLVWMRTIVLQIGWPPVGHEEGYYDRDSFSEVPTVKL
mgnify:CR=1 FL=1